MRFLCFTLLDVLKAFDSVPRKLFSQRLYEFTDGLGFVLGMSVLHEGTYATSFVTDMVRCVVECLSNKVCAKARSSAPFLSVCYMALLS